ncbi:MAG: RtcB family protein [Acidobacteria bacterium]|nr:RtcB family protein [Acidobacteriota bacterium]
MPKNKKDNYRLFIPRHGRMRQDAVIFTSPELKLEESAVNQLRNATEIPSVAHVSATPDIHHGYGVPIGSVIGTTENVIPAAVGYDINCGMRMLTTGIRTEEFNVERFALSLRQIIPLGEGKQNLTLSKDDFVCITENGLASVNSIVNYKNNIWEMYNENELKEQRKYVEDNGSLKGDIRAVSNIAIERGRVQLATLGGGNHFIEIQKIKEIFDEKIAEKFGLKEGNISIMIHTGSRGFGHQVGGDYMKKANETTLKIDPELARKQLGFLDYSKKDGENYYSAMNCAANFAFVNRYLLYLLVKKELLSMYPEAAPVLLYDVPHNILKIETHNKRNLFVHRKGATRAFGWKRMSGTSFATTGQPVLIPGSMGTSSYVLSGSDDNEDSLCSVNHGAGRVMSRTEAIGKYKKGKVVRKPAISDDEFKQAMKGIILHAENMKTIKEEAPQAYKDIDEVIKVVTGAGLSKKVARVIPLAVLKG